MANESTGTTFGRLSILFLSVEWIVFGSMHFSMVRETVAQMPDWVPWKVDIAIVTGILEVATGVLILVPELRYRAALLSLGLLVLLLPAMYHILDAPCAAAGNCSAGVTAFRTVLVPNNILLAICSIYLTRHPESSLAGPATGAARTRAPRLKRQAPLIMLIVPALLLMANCAGFVALAAGVPGHVALASLWAMSCIATGALTGFLFGVPRFNPHAAAAEDRLLPNTNVEAVSDWLTKILIGVGLVNFQAIGAFVERLGGDFSRAAGNDPAFGTGLIVYFFVVGIIQGYILTRLFLAPRFEETD